MNENPYKAPSEASAVRWPARGLNIWLFAMLWPLFSKIVHRIALPFVFRSPLLYGLSFAVPLLGYVVCVVAAIRYRASPKVRILRALGSILVLIASGLIYSVMMGDFP